MDYRSIVRSFHFVWNRGKWWLVNSLLINVCNALLPVATIWTMKELMNTMTFLLQTGSNQYGQAIELLAIQFFWAALTTTLRNVEEYINKTFELKLDHDLAEMIFRKTATVPFGYLDLPEFHHHHSRISGSMGFRFMSPIKQVINLFRETLRLGSVFAYLLSFHWILALLSVLVAIPFMIFQTRVGSHKWRLAFRQTPAARDAQYSAGLLADRQAAKEIRIFHLTDYLITRWSSKFQQNARESLTLFRQMKIGNNFLDILVSLFFGFSSWIVIKLSQRKEFGVGDFLAVTQTIQLTQSAFNQIATLLAQIYEENLYVQDFFAFVDLRVADLERKEIELVKPFPQLTSGIFFKNVHYRYPKSEKTVLHDVSFEIRVGEKIAIVGENGSGKTTLVKCLLGLYPVESGQIFFDDVSLEEIGPQELQSHITVVFQDFIKYAFTVQENIKLGNLTHLADDQRMYKAAKESGVDEFVQKFPLGYHTALGKFLTEGEDLSGGQWQKIALARSLFRGGDIFVLDEPTSALDPLAELKVFQQFNHLVKDKTAFFISHRMSAARMADRILVMKDGRLIEEGSHEELMAVGGEYARMYNAQAAWFLNETSLLKEVVEEWRSPSYS